MIFHSISVFNFDSKIQMQIWNEAEKFNKPSITRNRSLNLLLRKKIQGKFLWSMNYYESVLMKTKNFLGYVTEVNVAFSNKA